MAKNRRKLNKVDGFSSQPNQIHVYIIPCIIFEKREHFFGHRYKFIVDKYFCPIGICVKEDLRRSVDRK